MLSSMKIGLAALAAVSCAVLASGEAQAGRLFKFRFLQPEYYAYYPGQDNYYGPDDEDDYYYVPRNKRRQYYDQYEDDSYYDPQYQEPVYQKPPRKKTAKVVPGTKPAVKKATVASVKKPATTPAKQAGAGLSCDKATTIISGYGFTGVKATSCKGQTYAFNATRSGKNYVISLNATSGELTEVKKVR